MNSSQKGKFVKALIEFSPNVLFKHLMRMPDNTVCVNRKEIVRNKEDESKFYYILSRIYLSGYKDIENLTVYFDICKDTIIAGAYNVVSCKRISMITLISSRTNTPYTYTAKDINKFKSVLETY